MTRLFPYARVRNLAALMLVALLAACDSAEERLSEHLASARTLLEAGENEKALVELRNAFQIDRNHYETHMLYADYHEAEGNLSSMVGHLRKSLDLRPTDYEANLKLGRILLLGRALEDAGTHLDLALDARPNAAEALATRAAIALQSDETAEALRLARRALEIEPNMPGAGLVLVSERMQAEDWDAALSLLEGLRAAHPEDFSLALVKVRALERKGASEEIGAFLNEVIASQPERAEFRRILARWHISRQDLDGAIAAMTGLADLSPEDVSPRLDIARLTYASKGPDAARAYLEESAEAAGPKNRFAFDRALAALDLALGERAGALSRLQAMIASATNATDANTARIQLAQLLIEEDPKRAEKLVEDALSSDATMTSAMAMSAAFKIERGEIEPAILQLRRALNQSPNNVALLRLAATAQQRNGNPELALERLAAAVKASGYEPGLALGYARALIANRDSGPAEVVLSETVRRHPTAREPLVQLARLRLSKGDWSGAEQVARQLSEIAPAVAARVTAAALTGQERYEESIAVLHQLTEDPKERLSSMAAMVQVYLRAGRETAAIAFLDGLLADDPQNLAAIRLRAALHLRSGEVETAEEMLREGIALAPQNLAGYLTLANFLESKQNFEGAKAALREGLEAVAEATTAEEKRSIAAVQMKLASLHDRDGEWEAAIPLYQKIVDSQPQSVIAANNLAALIAEHMGDDPKEIERAYRIARPLRGIEVPEFQDTYGWVLYRRGNYQEALRRLAPAAAAVPDNPYIQYHAGLAFAQLGRTEDARSHLEAAVASPARFSKRDEAQTALDGLPEPEPEPAPQPQE